MIKKYRRLWCNSINLSGLWSKEPVELFFDWEHKQWWDKTGNLGIEDHEKVGLIIAEGYIKFSSSRYIEVKRWTEGVSSTLKLLRRWTY